MAFIGLFLAFLVIVIISGVINIISGNLICRKTENKKFGTALKILGYITAVPSVLFLAFYVLMAVITFIASHN